MSDVFQACRERVSAEEAARFYGVIPDRSGRALCPFHNDRHPSLSFHKGYFRCWSCGASGSAIDLAARLFGLTPLGAVRKLDGDFHLGLALDRPSTPQELEEARREREAREARRLFRNWREIQLRKLCAAIRAGNLALKRDPAGWTAGDCLAVRKKAELERLAELLEAGNEEEQRQVYRDREREDMLCAAILAAPAEKGGEEA